MSTAKTIKYFQAICIFVPLTCYLFILIKPIPVSKIGLKNALLFNNHENYHVEAKFQAKHPTNPPNDKITIATVACSANKTDTSIYEEALVMIKSVLISSILNNVDKLEFHIYLEDLKKQNLFTDSLKKFGFLSNDSMVSMHFHSAIDVIPKKYRDHMIYHFRFRCSYVRAFFPTVLPTVDSILYLDTDTIITGDISKLWSHLYEMKETQLIGVGYNNEKIDKNYGEMDKRLFGEIPHVKPKGINNGVILMNLTKMREYEWEEKLLTLYDTYSQVIKWMTIQRLMNILLYFNPDLLYIIRCEFHFIHTHCDKGLTCPYILDDPIGIHLIHGANNTFEDDGIFQPIFDTYNKFNMTRDDLVYDLYYPIRKAYQSRMNSESLCNRVLAENLFKNG